MAFEKDHGDCRLIYRRSVTLMLVMRMACDYDPMTTDVTRGLSHGSRFGRLDQEAQQDVSQCAPGRGRALPVADEPERRDRALADEAGRGAQHRPGAPLPSLRGRSVST